eukprot:4359513-Pleurochrysis_carterae.AAC.2
MFLEVVSAESGDGSCDETILTADEASAIKVSLRLCCLLSGSYRLLGDGCGGLRFHGQLESQAARRRVWEPLFPRPQLQRQAARRRGQASQPSRPQRYSGSVRGSLGLHSGGCERPCLCGNSRSASGSIRPPVECDVLCVPISLAKSSRASLAGVVRFGLLVVNLLVLWDLLKRVGCRNVCSTQGGKSHWG